MFKKAIVLSLIGTLAWSSLSYANPYEEDNTYIEPAEDNYNEYSPGQIENDYNQNEYNNDDFNEYGNVEEGNPEEDLEENSNDEGYLEEPSDLPADEEEEVEPEPEPEPIEEPEPEPEIEEPVEVYEEPEPAEDPEIQINQVETTEVEVSGKVVDEENEPIENARLILQDEEEAALEEETDENGSFSFQEVPSGEYKLTVEEAEGYEIDEESEKSFEVGNRNKSGLTFTLTTIEEEAVSQPNEVEAEDVASPSSGNLSPMDWTLIAVGFIFLVTGITVFIFKRLRT